MRFKLNKWLWLGITSELLVAPNISVMKYTFSGMNILYFTFLRYLVVLPFCIPALYNILKQKQLNKDSAKDIILASAFLALAILSFTYALRISNASYAAILGLAGPIFFIPLSIRLEKEKVNRKAVAGLSLAASGAFAVVILPIAFTQKGSLNFNPLASLLLILNLITWSLFIIYYRKINERGISLNAIMGFNAVSSIIVFGLLFGITSYAASGSVDFTITKGQIIAIVFSALIVTFLSRKWKITVYEKLGSASSSALDYLGSLLSILVSIIFLHEQLSIGVAVGGVLIILGLYISEYHKSEHHKHAGSMRHH